MKARISIVIPTYRREEILLATLKYLCELKPTPDEIILVDQTRTHQGHVQDKLASIENNGDIRWIRLSVPSIPHAMNVGLQEAKNEIVLFLDDDIIPDKQLIEGHLRAQTEGYSIVAGQVLQPGERPLSDEGSSAFKFCSGKRQLINKLMGGNFSIKRQLAMNLGGFDENFVHVAYRFEAEFADRAIAAGEKILFEPAASINHLKAAKGGTRSFGEHLKTIKSSHAVGAYYYLMISKLVQHRLFQIMIRPFRSVRTKYHLSHPWWIPITLMAEVMGLGWALFLRLRGPRYIEIQKK